MFERVSLIVYYKNPKSIKQIKRFGNVAYYHKKRRYAILYVNLKDQDEVVDGLKKLRHIRKVEVSQLDRDAYNLQDCQVKNLDTTNEL